MRRKDIFLRYLTPNFWLSLPAILVLIVIFRFLGLTLPRFNIDKIVVIFVLVAICLFVAFYKYFFIGFKIDSTVKALKKAAGLAMEFFFKILPFFVLFYVYDSIHDITYLINSFEFDWLLIKIDHFLLFGNDIALLLEKIIYPFLTYLMSLAYNFYFVFYLVNPVAYFFVKERKVFDLVLTTVVITVYLGLIGYVAVPCLGPVLAQQSLFTKELALPNGELYQSSSDLAATYVFARGAFHCFPSLHFGVPLVWLYFAWKYLRREKYLKYLYYLHIPAVSLLWFSTVYLRWHYLVDWLGGLIVALLGIWLAKKIINWWYNFWVS